MMGSAGITNEYGITNMYMNWDIHWAVSSGSAELNKGAFRTNEMGRWHEGTWCEFEFIGLFNIY